MCPVVSLGQKTPAVTQIESKPAVGQRDLVEHRADARAIGDVAGEADGGAAAGDPGAGDADAQAEFLRDFVGGGLRGFDLQVDAHDVGALAGEPVRRLLANAGTGPDDEHHLAGELLLGRHALQLRLLQQPVLDVEGLLLRQRDVAVDRLGAAHHLDRAVVEFGGDAATRSCPCPTRSCRGRG
jgi:hypothetical protein